MSEPTGESMKQPDDSAQESKKPYVGPRPYERKQRDLFFGREQEARDLLSLVITNRVVLFFA